MYGTVLEKLTISIVNLSIALATSLFHDHQQNRIMNPLSFPQSALLRLILGLRPANERRRDKVTLALIGWPQIWNQRWSYAPVAPARRQAYILEVCVFIQHISS